MSLSLDRPVGRNRLNNFENPPHPIPPINLDRPLRLPPIAKDGADINLDRPARVQKAMTIQPDIQSQHLVDHHSSLSLDRPTRPPAATSLLSLDRPVHPPAGPTDNKNIGVDLERPNISPLSLERPGRKRPPPISFDLSLQPPEVLKELRNLNLDRPGG